MFYLFFTDKLSVSHTDIVQIKGGQVCDILHACTIFHLCI